MNELAKITGLSVDELNAILEGAGSALSAEEELELLAAAPLTAAPSDAELAATAAYYGA